MSENLKIGFILVLIASVGVYSFYLLHGSRTRENYVFFGVVLTAFLVIYCVSILQYRITGSTVGIERALQQINASKKEISVVAETLVKMAAVIADGGGRFGGMPDVHQQQIEKYKESLQEYLGPNLDNEIRNTIQQLDFQIKERNKK